jgi:hypothetical protein
MEIRRQQMKQNMGRTDRIIRVLVGIVALLVAIFVTSGVVDIILYVIAAIMIITSLVGICPLYIPFGISTKK